MLPRQGLPRVVFVKTEPGLGGRAVRPREPQATGLRLASERSEGAIHELLFVSTADDPWKSLTRDDAQAKVLAKTTLGSP